MWGWANDPDSFWTYTSKGYWGAEGTSKGCKAPEKFVFTFNALLAVGVGTIVCVVLLAIKYTASPLSNRDCMGKSAQKAIVKSSL